MVQINPTYNEVDMSHPTFYLERMHIFEWFVVGHLSKNKYQNTCVCVCVCFKD